MALVLVAAFASAMFPRADAADEDIDRMLVELNSSKSTNEGVTCVPERLSDPTGTISSAGGGCGWTIVSDAPLYGIEFVVREYHFVGTDALFMFASEMPINQALVAIFTRITGMPPGFMLNSDKCSLWLRRFNDGTHIEISYSLLGINTFGRYGRSNVMLVVILPIVGLVSSVCCCLGLSYYWCQWRRIRIVLDQSELITAAEVARRNVTRRQEEEAALARAQTLAAGQAAEPQVVAALEALPTETWGALRNDECPSNDLESAKIEECSLCLEPFQNDDLLRVLPCSHHFHKTCIDTWFAARRLRPRPCPLCRRTAAAPEQISRSASNEVIIRETAPPETNTDGTNSVHREIVGEVTSGGPPLPQTSAQLHQAQGDTEPSNASDERDLENIDDNPNRRSTPVVVVAGVARGHDEGGASRSSSAVVTPSAEAVVVRAGSPTSELGNSHESSTTGATPSAQRFPAMTIGRVESSGSSAVC
eukprot:TRINITY_DN33471_c0_g1_i1.p1 TRINITY_DN33471_c0_g1~~TRINITY_DN33471_c0_g1_i1.p1  ORF type:complete len:546 (-),score=75.10 TRINITY_DN33471_c0_g1_i1:120-1553(-)